MPRLLLDENIGKIVARKLRKLGYDVESIIEVSPGVDDESILERALKGNRILVTLDRDFGRLVFLESRGHVGIIYFRLRTESPANILRVLVSLLGQYGGKLGGKFTTVTEESIRMR